jgi:hypothetical protein
MLVAFVLIELRVRRPMLDLSLFKYPQFVGVQLLPIATCYSYVVLLILLPLRFVGVQELSEIDAGLLMLLCRRRCSSCRLSQPISFDGFRQAFFRPSACLLRPPAYFGWGIPRRGPALLPCRD